MAYIQLTTDKPVWPLYTIEDDPKKDHNFTNATEQCFKRLPSALGKDIKDIWVR